MNPTLLVSLALAVAPPFWLSDPAPDALLRWSALPLRDAGSGRASASAEIGGARSARFELAGAGVLRLTGRFAPGCDPRVARRSERGPAHLDLPLPASGEGEDRIVQIAPAVAPQLPSGQETAGVAGPAAYVLSLPSGCAPVRVQAWAAAAERDEYALTRAAIELRAAVARAHGVPEALDWLSAKHPHRWQVQAALAFALPHLLGAAPGRDEAARALARGWAEQAIAEARADDPTGARASALDGPGAPRELAGSPRPYFELRPGGEPLRGETGAGGSLRLFVRAPIGAAAPRNALFRVEVQFDAGPAEVLSFAAGPDPEHAGLTRERSAALAAPAGSKSVAVRALDGVLLARGAALTHERHLEDVLSAHTAEAHWRNAEDAGRADPRGALAAALARLRLGHLDGVSAAAASPAVAALLAAARAEREPDAQRALVAVREGRAALETLGAPGAARSLALASAPLLETWLVEHEARALARLGRFREAADALYRLSSRAELTTEDAVLLADLEARVDDPLRSEALALQVLDGLIAARPLDRAAQVARARHWTLATSWRALSAGPGPSSVRFLEPLEQPLRSARARRSAYVELEAGESPVGVELPAAAQPGRLPVLSFVTFPARPGAIARVRIDGRVQALPAMLPFERFDVPVAAGSHRVELEPGFEGGVHCNWSPSRLPLQLRRYWKLPDGGLTLFNDVAGMPASASVALRLALPAGASAPASVAIRVEAGGGAPLVLQLAPGAARYEERSDLGPGTWVSAPVEATLPLGRDATQVRVSADATQAQVLVNVAVRRRQAIAPADLAAAAGAQDSSRVDAPRALAAVREATAAIAGRQDADARLHLARAQALLALSEAGLAREDLLVALDGRPLPDPERAAALGLWEGLDQLEETVPAEAEFASVALELLGRTDLDAGELAALAPELDRLDPAQLRARAGREPVASLAQLAAAGLAERSGDSGRASQLWRALAAAHPRSALVRREAGEALLRLGRPADRVAAHAELTGALQLDPDDAATARLLRRAEALTRLVPLRFPESSGGAVAVPVRGAQALGDSVESALVPPGAETAAANVLTRGRQVRVAANLKAAARLAVRARAMELRPGEARATSAPRPFLEVALDGEAPRRVECADCGLCELTGLALPAGPVGLTLTLDGGVRPLALAWLLPDRPIPGLDALRAEYLVARPTEPVRLSVEGPAALRIELRTRSGAAAATAVSLSATAPGAEPVNQLIAVERARLASAAPDLGSTRESPLGPGRVETLVLRSATRYAVELRPRGGEALVRVAVREADPVASAEPPPPARPSAFQPAAAAPPTLTGGARVRLEGGDVALGLDSLGTFSATASASRRFQTADGETYQPIETLAAGLGWRRRVESLGLTLELDGELRLHPAGPASQAAGAELYFRPETASWLRASLAFEGARQQLDGAAELGGAAEATLEPVLNPLPGLFLVTKVGARLRGSTLEEVPEERLGKIDPDVFTEHGASHGRAALLQESIELQPLANVVFAATGRVTTNPSASPLDLDRASASAAVRAIFGRVQLEAGGRSTWLLADGRRADTEQRTTAWASAGWTLWVNELARMDLGLWAARSLSTGQTELALSMRWEASNGRRFRDHTPRDEESAFFGQRGPGWERGRLVEHDAAR